MFRVLFFIFLAFFSLNAKDINPNFTYLASGGVNDLVLVQNKLYAATSASSVDVFDINTQTKIKSIKLPKIKDFLGDEIDSKIYSVDTFNEDVLILSQGNKGGRAINIYKNSKLHEIISDKKRMFIAKAKFIDKQTIIFALLSNELYLYDLVNKKIKKIVQISHSKFSSFTLTKNKDYVIVADESGIVRMLDTKNLEVKKVFKGENVDNLFQVETKKDLIITAGQDRRCAVYNMNKDNAYYKKADFLIYSVGLSKNSTLGAFASNENNDVTVFDTNTKQDLYTLKQNPAILTNILFKSEDEIFVSSDQEKINYYKLK